MLCPGKSFLNTVALQMNDSGEGERDPVSVYICLLTGPVTWAVHLELIKDMSAKTF